ncbi:MAG TPA: bifunctional oligoribonuclease/PAP phosphatase NrnA, partial [bacterium]|nr:bifunctional oligoribonuclease/PAP phosphatase NrnA [bacterium]
MSNDHLRQPEEEKLSRILRVIAEKDAFFLTTHTTPDGDGLACELALLLFLERHGKKAVVVNADPVPEIYRFLPAADRVTIWPGSRDRPTGYEVVFVLDCGNLPRLGPVSELIKLDAVVINIDHHIRNTNFGAINWVNPSYAACGEMLFYLLKRFGPPTREEAICLYTALMTDTGSFLYHLGPGTFSIAQQLVDYGASPEEIGQHVYFERPLVSLQLLSLCLTTLKFDACTGVCWARVSQEMYRRTGTDEEDTEKFVDYLRCVKEARLVFLLKERSNGVKVSLRSRRQADVEKIARFFGGGGH